MNKEYETFTTTDGRKVRLEKGSLAWANRNLKTEQDWKNTKTEEKEDE